VKVLKSGGPWANWLNAPWDENRWFGIEGSFGKVLLIERYVGDWPFYNSCGTLPAKSEMDGYST